jgi:hypothetical protein
VNKWFKKQHRTDTDAKLDEIDPNRREPKPIDNDAEAVAPATHRDRRTVNLPGGDRPLKGGYWFVREKYRAEAAAAVRRDKERGDQARRDEEEEQARQHAPRLHMRHESPRAAAAPAPPPGSRPGRRQPREQDPGDEEEHPREVSRRGGHHEWRWRR